MNYIIYSKLRVFTISLLFLFCFVLVGKAQTVTMPNIIGSNMVLQQNTQVPVWGWAAAGTSVIVTPSWGQPVTVITGTTGKWMTKIQTPVAIPGQAPTYTLTITGPSNSISYTNILVGEVWLCSGQSNMWFPMKASGAMLGVVDYVNEIAAANFPNIRLFTVPLGDAAIPAANCGGSWASCTPTTVSSFSAVAYYFGREIYNNKAVNVPIGLINGSYWGSSIQTWIKDSVLQADADLKKKYVDKDYATATNNVKPSLVYNAMIAPIIPFAIKGAIWYQGESNVSDGALYTKANLALVKDWRASWGSVLSFYAVQLTSYLNTGVTKDLDVHRAFFHEAQSNIMTDPKIGIVVNSDLLLNAAERYQVHPQNKKDIGIRLALWALAKDYNQPVQYLGPTYQSFSVESNKVRITYKPESIGGGLITKDGKIVSSFRIAGADKLFYPALAVIDGNTVIVSSTYVSSPVAVRYAFSDGAMTNLMNKDGVAAFPFRTDSWVEWPYPYIFYVDMPEPTDVKRVLQETVSIFPNPFRENLTIKGINSGIKKIDIFDIMGRKVKSQVIENLSSTNLNVSEMAEGQYIIRITQMDLTTQNFKVFKQKVTK